MRIISFAWTTPALLAGRKTVTRRDWSPRWVKFIREGDEMAAYDKSPRYGGRQVGVIRLTAPLVQEWTNEAPPSDYEAEGFTYLEEQGMTVDGLAPPVLWRAWHFKPQLLYVVRFELVSTELAART